MSWVVEVSGRSSTAPCSQPAPPSPHTPGGQRGLFCEDGRVFKKEAEWKGDTGKQPPNSAGAGMAALPGPSAGDRACTS